MSLLPDPFPIPDWQLDTAHYPSLFLVDKNWAKELPFTYGVRSFCDDPLLGSTPLDTHDPRDHHGEKMLQVIRSLARGLSSDQVILTSLERKNVLGNTKQHFRNLPEALMCVQIQLQAGDLVIINIGADSGGDSFARDSLIAILLESITNSQHGIVVISAGNLPQPLLPTLTSNVVVVGGVSSDGQPQSRFGDFITCYGVVPYNLPDLPPSYTISVPFDLSSAATAYIGGMVLMMLNYARSKGVILTSKQVVGLLKANGNSFQVLLDSGITLGNLPDWSKLRPAIDVVSDGLN